MYGRSVIKFIIFTLLFLPLFTNPSPLQAGQPYLDRPLEFEILDSGQIMVTDGGGYDWTTTGSEVFIFDRQGNLTWHLIKDLLFAHSAHLFSNNQVVITDTTGNRILAVDLDTQEIIWTSDNWTHNTGELSDGTHLNYPNEALELANHHLLVTDRNNDRVLEVDSEGKIYWQYNNLFRPHNASQLLDGSILVSDSESHRVVRLNRSGDILWQYSGDDRPLNWPRDVQLLPNGNYLITDTRNHRIIEVTPEKNLVWEYSKGLYWPYEAERLPNGNTVISDSQNARLVEVTPDQQITWQLSQRPPQNLHQFQNGSFEKLQDSVLQAWIPADLLAEGSGKLSFDSNTSKSGNNSARIDYQNSGHIFWLQQVPVVTGKEYQFSGWIKTDLQSSPNSWSRFELWWRTDLGGYIDPPLISEKSLSSTDWTKQTWSGTPPVGASSVEIRALTTGSGTAWFDDITWQSSSFRYLHLLYILVGFTSIILVYQVFNRLKHHPH